MSADRDVDAAETTGASTGPELVHQAHGGALLRGGIPGHRGGGGRPPSEVREASRSVYARDGIRQLRRILRSPTARNADKIQAAQVLGRFGGVERLEVDQHVGGLLEELLREAAADPFDALADAGQLDFPADGIPRVHPYPPVPTSRDGRSASGRTPEPADSHASIKPQPE